MNTENIIQNADPAAAPETGEKTFTQDDVNRIVQERLAKDRAKSSEELARREQELLQREFWLDSRQKLIDRGYRESLAEALNCSSREAFDRALDMIDSLIKERTPSPEEREAMAKAAANAPSGCFTAQSQPRRTGMDMIREAMKL